MARATFFSDAERALCIAAAEHLLPAGEDPETQPGATRANVIDYIEGLLTAFEVDPPRIWCGGPWADRGGDTTNHYLDFVPLGRIEEIAWRTRIEGSLGIPEREFNGPVRGYREIYRDGLAALGDDFAALSEDERQTRLDAQPELRDLLWQHTCEGAYAAPEYGGNRDQVTWVAIGYDGDTLPRGWSDDEVTFPSGRHQFTLTPVIA